MTSPRVLLIAEAANPDWVSVPLVGWSHAEALARGGNVHVVTQVRNREAILARGWKEGEDFTAIDSEAAARPIWHFERLLRRSTGLGWSVTTALAALPYYYFERLVWSRFGEAIRAGEYDLVHRLTPLSPTIPSTIAARCKAAGVPYVLGPLNGGVPWPSQFRAVQHREGEWLSYVRDAYKLLPAYRSTRANASAIIAGSQATLDQLPPSVRDRCVYIPENAVDPRRFSRQVEGEVGDVLRLSFVGRLVPYKGADMLLEAAAPLIRAGKVRIDILGDGPEMDRLVSLRSELAIEEGVELAGWVPHEQVQDRLVKSDVFAFPSVREFGGGVVLEAMSLGIVPLVLDYAGPRELVTDDCGFRVPLGSREEVVAGFRERIEALVSDPSGIRAMGARARERAFRLYSWEEKALQTRRVWRWVVGAEEKPSFGMPLTRTAAET